jgi:hypothetical protein
MTPSDWRAGFAPALLVVVAVLQIGLTQFADLTPWLGGGFGMFSTLDSPGARHVHAFLLTPGVEREIEIGSKARDSAQRVRALPTTARLRALASILESGLPRDEPDAERLIRIQVWQSDFDPDRFSRSSALLRVQDFEFGGG